MATGSGGAQRHVVRVVNTVRIAAHRGRTTSQTCWHPVAQIQEVIDASLPARCEARYSADTGIERALVVYNVVTAPIIVRSGIPCCGLARA
jgi:hypothetical protein